MEDSQDIIIQDGLNTYLLNKFLIFVALFNFILIFISL